jgi:protein-S-isoprenylcysteine O-methyltransferase Ste14
MSRTAGQVLVVLQFLVGGGLVAACVTADGGGSGSGAGPWILATAAVALGVWAASTVGRHLRAAPYLPEGARLVTHGPFRWVRNPMYTAALTLMAALVWARPTIVAGALWFALALVLAAKIRIEEQELAGRFPEYEDYRRRTKRFIPGVF